MSKRELPPITEPVTREELMNIFYREVYSVKDKLTEADVRKLLASVGLNFDRVQAEMTA